MQIKQCIVAYNHIDNLGETKNYQHLYERTKLAKWLQEQATFYAAEEQKLANTYGHLEGNQVIFDGDKEQAALNAKRFTQGKSDLDAVDVEAPPKITVLNADLNGTALSSETVLALEPFIDFEFMGENDGDTCQR